jgi:hypothetical protein
MSISMQRAQRARFTIRQQCHVVLGAVEPDEQLHACTRATGERRRLSAPSRHNKRETKIGGCARERVHGNDRHAAIKIYGWCGGSCRCKKCVE